MVFGAAAILVIWALHPFAVRLARKNDWTGVRVQTKARLGWAIASGAVLAFVGCVLGFSVAGFVVGAYALVLVLISIADMEARIIPNVLALAAAALGLALSPLLEDVGFVRSILGLAAGAGIFLVLVVVSRGRIGEGDVKLAGALGAMCGLPVVLVALLLGIVGSGLVAIALVAVRVRRAQDICDTCTKPSMPGSISTNAP